MTSRTDHAATAQPSAAQPLVSIVLPVYNAEDFLDECLSMIARQTYPTIEIIAVNDGSTDASPRILDAWRTREPRLRVIGQENQGAGAARNRGMDEAAGDYLLFLDPDDLFDARLVAELVASARSANADIAVCASALLDFQSRQIAIRPWTLRKDLLPSSSVFAGADIADRLFVAFMGWPWDKLFKTSFVRENALRYPALANSEDGPFVYTALCAAKRITVNRKPLVTHTMNRVSSLSFSRRNDALCFFDAIRETRRMLEERELAGQFSRGFNNWALSFSIWNLNTAHPQDKDAIFAFLKEEGLSEMGAFAHENGYYDLVRDDYASACMVRDLSFPEYLEAAVTKELQSSRVYRLSEKIAAPLKKAESLLTAAKIRLARR